MQRSAVLLASMAALVFALSACAPAANPNLKTWSFENHKFVTRAEISPTFEPSKYKTFTVVRLAGVKGVDDRSPIEEEQMLFVVATWLEAQGYKYVNGAKDADFAVAIGVIKNEYKTQYVPPSSVTVPVYVPGRTYTSNSTASGSAYGFGSGGWASAWGSSQSTTTTRSSGYYTTQTYAQPGYTTGNYYPAVLVFGMDVKNQDELFKLSSVAVSNIPDIRIAFPFLMADMVSKLPVGQSKCDVPQHRDKSLGINLSFGTLDGNRYFPIVTGPVKGHSPHVTSGSIEPFDLILSANGKSLENLSYCQFVRDFNSDYPTYTFTLLRGGNQVQAVLMAY